MGNFELEREIEINAPPEKIFGLIADVNDWPRYKDFIKGVSFKGGGIGADSKFTMKIAVKGPAVPVPVKVIEFDPPNRLAWTGGLPGASVSVHGFDLTARGDGTLVKSWEKFHGALVGLMLVMVTPKDLDSLHDRWLSALKNEAEKPGT